MQHEICHMHHIKFSLFLPIFLFLDPFPTMEPGHKPMPSVVFEVADRHSVVGHKNWPKYTEEDVLQAVNGLDPKFCEDYDRVSKLTLLNILFFPCNNTYALNYCGK